MPASAKHTYSNRQIEIAATSSSSSGHWSASWNTLLAIMLASGKAPVTSNANQCRGEVSTRLYVLLDYVSSTSHETPQGSTLTANNESALRPVKTLVLHGMQCSGAVFIAEGSPYSQWLPTDVHDNYVYFGRSYYSVTVPFIAISIALARPAKLIIAGIIQLEPAVSVHAKRLLALMLWIGLRRTAATSTCCFEVAGKVARQTIRDSPLINIMTSNSCDSISHMVRQLIAAVNDYLNQQQQQ
eukprot:18617-Heterococcus_DN1.PRE.2